MIAHLLLLQFISQVPFTPIIQSEIVPITIVLEKAPVVTKVTAAPPPKTVVSKKIAPAPRIKTVRSKLSRSPISTAETGSTAPPAVSAVESAAPVEATTPALTALVPPSASYLLDVIRTEPQLSNPYTGAGKIRWHHDGKSYTMQVDAGIDMLFTTIDLYRMQSEGAIGDTGIKPYKATETRRGRTTTTTQFNYDDKLISFSADAATIPLSEGAQDKITVIMQLASLGNADPSQFQPEKEITIQVAEEKEANLHQFVVLDQETIETKLGRFTAWHIVRPPRAGVYSSRIDIWLAPELNWLPVQIRNTEANGAITTQTVRQIIQE